MMEDLVQLLAPLGDSALTVALTYVVLNFVQKFGADLLIAWGIRSVWRWLHASGNLE